MKTLQSILFSLFVMTGLSTNANDDLLKLIPSDCNIVMGFKISEIFKIPLVKDLVEKNKEMLESQMSDPQAIKTMLLGVKADSETALMGADMQPQVFMVMEMNEATSLEKMLEIGGKDIKFKKSKFLDKEYYEGEKDGQTLGIFKVSDTQFIAGTKDLLHKGIMINKGMGNSLSENAIIKKLLKSEGSLLYAGGFMTKSEEYKGFSLMSNYDKGIKLHTRVYCKKEDTATKLSTQINAVLPMVTANPQLGIKPTDITVASKATTVSISAFISEATLKQIPVLIQSMLMQSMTGESTPQQ